MIGRIIEWLDGKTLADQYEPDQYDEFPHNLYECSCGNNSVAVGWEVETVRCTHCNSYMEFANCLWYPDPPEY